MDEPLEGERVGSVDGTSDEDGDDTANGTWDGEGDGTVEGIWDRAIDTDTMDDSAKTSPAYRPAATAAATVTTVITVTPCDAVAPPKPPVGTGSHTTNLHPEATLSPAFLAA